MFSAKLNLYKPFSRLITKNKLLTLDIIYQSQPFVNIVSSNQNTYNLDTIYKSQPFIGIPNNYIKRPSLIGINHPDVETWLNTLSLSGGTASSSTISALNTFCNSIDSAGLRRKFYRLNLFCGDNLNSCLVPLYVSSWWNESCIGFSIDQNFNFTSADYNETGANGGLKGNGTNKRLDTGLPGSSLLPGNRHLSAYEVTAATSDYSPAILSIGSNTANMHGLGSWTSSTQYRYRTHNAIGGNPVSTNTNGMWLGSDESSTASSLYRNGSTASSVSEQNAGGFGASTYQILGHSSGEWSDGRLAAYSIGLSMSNNETLIFYNIMQTFQTALNRNV